MSCPECFRGTVHTRTQPTGGFQNLGGIRTYIAGGSDPTRSKSTIIYLPDAFSLRLVNNMILADKYAELTGCRVLIPDIVFNNGLNPDIFPYMEMTLTPIPKFSVRSIAQKVLATLYILPQVLPFVLFGHPKRVYPKLLQFTRAMRQEIPAGGKLGVSGFCWGGWGSTMLCTETTIDGGSERLIDAQFNGHPSYLNESADMIRRAIEEFRVPYSSAVAGDDWEFNAQVANNIEANIRERLSEGSGDGNEDYKYEFKVYKGCKHGFCVRAKEDEINMEGYNAALLQAVNWFNKYLN
ncbi:hypothetical protein AYO21_08414 [Fonsecaea monophora]|uniref:Dienelactone hydrolase domain-containing protein n=1 Tax=Fonsecaea monophora TaxID=254056 RepID=A0A177EZ50_9EURO|nr:hypothetical protein AYO21_08414 [Fonsecaea monophora]OAG37337.1 hypothetical protein AYO21_08414 [Fonsecaea monophora]